MYTSVITTEIPDQDERKWYCHLQFSAVAKSKFSLIMQLISETYCVHMLSANLKKTCSIIFNGVGSHES